MKVLKKLKGVSLSSTSVIERGGIAYVRKSISHRVNREYGLVRWHSQIRKQQILENVLRDLVVSISDVGVDGNDYYFDMPFICGGLNCADALMKGAPVNLMADQIIKLINRLGEFTFKPVMGTMSLFIAEEICRPLQSALIILPNESIFSNSEKKELEERILEALIIAQFYQKKYAEITVHESLTHGNMTLENLIWNPEKSSVVIIDPYAETYCESINGDFSQLLQSTESGYEFVAKFYDENDDFDIFKYPEDQIPSKLKMMSEELTRQAKTCDWYDKQLVQIFHAAQFVRMFPFKLANNAKHAYGFMVHGLDLIKRVE